MVYESENRYEYDKHSWDKKEPKTTSETILSLSGSDASPKRSAFT